jgi:hypothetical protein
LSHEILRGSQDVGDDSIQVRILGYLAMLKKEKLDINFNTKPSTIISPVRNPHNQH